MESGFIRLGDVKLYYTREGQGPVMVLLNGGPGFSHEYLQELRRLADSAELIFFDQRGTGRSGKAPPQEYTIEKNVEDMERLRQALHIERWIVFGHSWGGILAQAYATQHPQCVTKLILADTFSCAEDCNAALQRMRDAVPEETRAVYERCEQEGLYKDRDRYPDEYQAALDIAYEPVMISVPAPEYLQYVFSKLAYDVYRAMWGEQSEFKLTGTLAKFDFREALGQLQVPGLVIVGSNDMPSVEMARETARRLPHARLEVFEGSRHYPFLEEPEKFFKVLREFLQE